jgi:hypothetical protein
MMTVEPCMSWESLENANTVTNTAAQRLRVRSWNRMDHATIIEQIGYVHNNLSDFDKLCPKF